MPEARPNEAPKTPRSKWVMQLHRKPVRWDVLLHKLSEALARRYWFTQAHFQQEILRLERDELWDAAIHMSRAFGAQTSRAAIAILSGSAEPSIFSLQPANLDRVVADGTRAILAAMLNYVEIAHNCFLKRNHPDLQRLTPRVSQTLRRFLLDKCAAGAELYPCIQNPLGDDDGYFSGSILAPDPVQTSGSPGIDAYRLQVQIHDDDGPAEIMARLIAFANTDPFIAPEYAVEMVTQLAAAQMQAQQANTRRNNTADAIAIRSRFLFSPCRQGGRTPVELFLSQQPFASEQQKQRLSRWADEQTDGVFRIVEIADKGGLLRDVASERELSLRNEPVLQKIGQGKLIRARLLPWDDHWILTGVARELDESSDEQHIKPHLHPLRTRRRADEKDPRLTRAREYVQFVHRQFLEFFGEELVCFGSLEECRKRLAEFHYRLVIEAKTADGRQFADAWREDVGMDFPPFLEDHFAENEPAATAPGVLYDACHGMAFLPAAEDLKQAITSPSPAVEQKQAFARLLLEKWRPGWVLLRLAQDHPERVQEIIRDLLGEGSFELDRDLQPLLGRLKCPEHTLPQRPVPFLSS